MTQPLSTNFQRDLLADLNQLSADRVKAESAAAAGLKARNAAAEKSFYEDRQKRISIFQTKKEATEREFDEVRQAIVTQFEADSAATDKEYQAVSRAITVEFETGRDNIRRELQDAKWTATTIYDAAKQVARASRRKIERGLSGGVEQLGAAETEARRLMGEWGFDDEYEALTTVGELPPAGTPDERTSELVAQAEAQIAQLRGLVLPKIWASGGLVWFNVALWGVTFFPVVWLIRALLGPQSPPGLAWLLGLFANSILIVAAARGIRYWLGKVSLAQSLAICRALKQTIADAEAFRGHRMQEIASEYNLERAKIRARRDTEVQHAIDHHKHLWTQVQKQREEKWQAAEEKYPRLLAEIARQRNEKARAAEEKYPHLLAEIRETYDRDVAQLQETYEAALIESRRQYDSDWQALATQWRTGLEEIRSRIDQANRSSDELFPMWNDPVWNDWVPPVAPPPAIRFGTLKVTPSQIPGAVPKDPKLADDVLEPFSLPALLSFPDQGSMLMQASEAGRAVAEDALQTVMLRFLTSLPPGKVRFTIVDPVGLGQNFAAFMHLADFDEQLVANRIWTEPSHIEQRLADLTAHMENVIQKYLRNEFATIEEYNAQAGEVAEPFRFLVVANFPTNFNDATARRLVSIVKSGPRCGVYTLVTVDTKKPMPQGFQLVDLEQSGALLHWNQKRFVWTNSDFENLELSLDPPPPAEFFTRILQVVGEKARDASRVEVPFDSIAPPRPQWWSGDSRFGVDVPLGPCGATKRQHLKLGRGTSQHVLIAGKTGSGKSTLLHAIITNLALWYSPQEVELYLIDFKKGVEFKTYATHELPHARVVAIESEREFGLSVLQRLDMELKLRGDRFREVGAQDLPAFRDAKPDAVMPRILLIVDEFQEFFVEDDKLAQDVSLLLDRLVRQGRAFGVHVLLGSQTLGGAYSLARSTLGQMAVRIALQCSEADAHLILSENNSAARLLSRPGEAIYNDANGLVEGNNPFQVVWLSDDRREDYLGDVQSRARDQNAYPTGARIVFEGNSPADATKNYLLEALLDAPTWPPAAHAATAWLGSAIAIKDPTAAVFRPQSGSNLLMVGQQDLAAMGMFSTAMISLAAQHPPFDGAGEASSVKFYVLDGTLPDAPEANFYRRLSEIPPHPVRVGNWRELPEIVAEIADEVVRRQSANDTEAPPIYLFVHDLQRFRDLRKQDDDFSFSRRGEEKPNPAKQFGTILRDGPGFGVHSIVWCDSLNNLNRTFDRQTLREFEIRVLFPMSAADSSTLIDSPLAGKLGHNRALFHTEEEGRLEKFRPYGMPSEDWLRKVRQQLHERSNANVGD